jgi:hypothetical protein
MFDHSDLTPLDKTEKRRYLMRHFIVTGNKAEKLFKTFRHSVVCKDLNRAVAMTEAQYPGCVILNIADQGTIDKVDA